MMKANKHTQLTERLYDEHGTLLQESPYPFKRLFAVGQEQIINSTPMTVLSCQKNGDTVTTVVRCHKPWKSLPSPSV